MQVSLNMYIYSTKYTELNTLCNYNEKKSYKN